MLPAADAVGGLGGREVQAQVSSLKHGLTLPGNVSPRFES